MGVARDVRAGSKMAMVCLGVSIEFADCNLRMCDTEMPDIEAAKGKITANFTYSITKLLGILLLFFEI